MRRRQQEVKTGGEYEKKVKKQIKQIRWEGFPDKCFPRRQLRAEKRSERWEDTPSMSSKVGEIYLGLYTIA